MDYVTLGRTGLRVSVAGLASILKPPLPAADRARLAELFGHLRGVGLEAPPRRG